MRERYRETFNDGQLVYGHKVTSRSATGKAIGKVFEPEGRLNFNEVSAREADYRLVGAMGSNLTLKIKTPWPPSFERVEKNKLIIRIKETEYDVVRVDPDKFNRVLYFYLEKVGAYDE